MAVLDYCKGVFTSPVTLNGLGQANDGQSVEAAGERWLLADDSVNGGIWITSAGDWERAPDLNDPADFVWGTTVHIQGGNRYFGSEWYYNGIDNPTIDATSLYFNLRTYGAPESDLLDVQESHIEGLGLSFVDGGTIGLGPGQAYVPALGKVLSVDADQTAARLTGATDMVYYAYLEEYPAGSGLGRLRLIVTEPGAPYLGSARTQSDDPTARYLGMLRNAGSLMPFAHRIYGGSTVKVDYLNVRAGSGGRILNGFTGDTLAHTIEVGPGAVTAANRLVPASAQAAEVFAVTTGSAEKYLGPDLTNISYATTQTAAVGADYRDIPVDDVPAIYYQLANSADALTLYVTGYYERR